MVVSVQIVLRLYKTPSEIIHGFDVDCCSLGYDGQNVYMTHHACFALANGYNTFNFDLMSPTYEKRLAKYGTRGTAIKVSDFERSKVKENSLKTCNPQYCKGLDFLLVTEYQYSKQSRGEKIAAAQKIRILAEEDSDYAGKLYSSSYAHKDFIHEITEYLLKTADKYPDQSNEYKPLLEQAIEEEYWNKASCLRIEKLLFTKKIYSVTGRAKALDLILEVPDLLYQGFEILKSWDFPAKLTWKVTNPGEQMTNTFHRIVLDDKMTWYRGKCYQI